MPVIIEDAEERRAALRHRDHHAQLPALLAPQEPGDLPRRGAVVRAHGRAKACSPRTRRRAPCASWRSTRSTRPASSPRTAARLRDMIANRPDWCISRQRSWGVPLPFFLHKETGELHPRTMEILDQAADIVEKPAASRPGAASRPSRSSAAPTRRTTARAATSWRSGSIRARPSGTLLRQHPGGFHGEGPEADLYLEGHDQHRGWFHSSLLLACARSSTARPTAGCSRTASRWTARAAR